MKILINRLRGEDNAILGLDDIPFPSVDPTLPCRLFPDRPKAQQTDVISKPKIATMCSVGAVLIKDERDRMGLGSFKALGAAYVIAYEASQGDVTGRTFVTASAGNHGLSVAAGAVQFGAKAVIYIAQTVPETFAKRLRDQGGEVRRQGATYEDSMRAASQAAEQNGWDLLSDSSWPGYTKHPHRLMQGYLVLMAELETQLSPPPSHIFVQAGVGGLAGAVAAYARQIWQDDLKIIVVEPTAAPALAGSIAAGAPTRMDGPVSSMGRLDCKEPSLIALKGLARDADAFATISENEADKGLELAQQVGMPSTTSGAAGLAGLLAAGSMRDELGLTELSRVLLILSEGAY